MTEIDMNARYTFRDLLPYVVNITFEKSDLESNSRSISWYNYIIIEELYRKYKIPTINDGEGYLDYPLTSSLEKEFTQIIERDKKIDEII